MLQQRGRAHEARVLASFERDGCKVTKIENEIEGADSLDAITATVAAMARGADVIYQAALQYENWVGRPDFLLRVDAPAGTASRFGNHLYEPVDAKLAREEKARAVLQLCAYADMLGGIQGLLPRNMHLALGRDARLRALSTADYICYFRRAKGELEAFVARDPMAEPYPFGVSTDYSALASRLGNGELQVVGGTSFAWTNKAMRASVDVLFIEEAGQVSLANALAVSSAAKSLVLLGDPAQLDQPTKGVHPPGADVSALAHMLGPAVTMPVALGVFLPETRRLHPDICSFTSETFYEGRLRPISGLDRQRVNGPLWAGSGLRYLPVEHTGNTNSSDEEAEQVAALVRELYTLSPTFCEVDGRERPLRIGDGHKDVLVVAPYNAQVALLKRKLPNDRVEVGTVDKFQGKEAPIVIYSMTSSSGDDAPRGLEFLYSLNRLNVATSRAQALVILVSSPSLVRARCKTPRHLKLVNALCAYLERSKLIQRLQ